MARDAQRGTVVTVRTDRGFGFLRPDDGSVDVFFHATALQNLQFDETLLQRDVVFTLTPHDQGRGPRAGRVWSVA